jgi:hypothetical protein
MDSAAEKPVRKKPFTYEDYVQWELRENERYELIEGAGLWLCHRPMTCIRR